MLYLEYTNSNNHKGNFFVIAYRLWPLFRSTIDSVGFYAGPKLARAHKGRTPWRGQRSHLVAAPLATAAEEKAIVANETTIIPTKSTMLALKKKREAEKKEKEDAAKREAAAAAEAPSVTAPAEGGGQVSLFGIGGQKRTKKGEAPGTKKSPGEIRIQKGKFLFPFLISLSMIESTHFN